MTKKIAVINDLSGFGKCSLTAAISVIAAMGVQPCPLPTAILSAQTGYPSYFLDDYTDRMDEFRKEWKKMGASFDGIYTGFMAGGAQIREVFSFLDDFYKLYKETAARDGIALHSKKYYGNLLLLAQKNGKNVRVYLACHEGDVLAGIITYFSEKEGVYLYGASSNIKRNLMPAYSLQWRAIRDARLSGCKTYDFYGIPPVEDPNHPMYGLYRFKTGFGGVIVHRAGSFDFPVKRILYQEVRSQFKRRCAVQLELRL